MTIVHNKKKSMMIFPRMKPIIVRMITTTTTTITITAGGEATTANKDKAETLSMEEETTEVAEVGDEVDTVTILDTMDEGATIIILFTTHSMMTFIMIHTTMDSTNSIIHITTVSPSQHLTMSLTPTQIRTFMSHKAQEREMSRQDLSLAAMTH
mmetsp:Transcript_8510/g.12326  ORF Transcript_8510/g.12326 Transcript_8510/m.12326 type:complete len:154 (-) Transcript_8510:1363-1824(-)